MSRLYRALDRALDQLVRVVVHLAPALFPRALDDPRNARKITHDSRRIQTKEPHVKALANLAAAAVPIAAIAWATLPSRHTPLQRLMAGPRAAREPRAGDHTCPMCSQRRQ